MKTTYRAKWGSNTVSVSADWDNAGEEIRGLPGLRVADFAHDGWAALRMALTIASAFAAISDRERETEIDEILAAAKWEAVPGAIQPT